MKAVYKQQRRTQYFLLVPKYGKVCSSRLQKVDLGQVSEVESGRLHFDRTHLSKWPSDLNINGTQDNVTFSDPAFHGLPCAVLLFAASVSFKNQKVEAPDWLLKNSSHSEGVFLKLTLS